MTTTTHTAYLDTALTGIALAAIQRARQAQELQIQALLRAHADRLRAEAVTLLRAKPDPALWTPADHLALVLATSQLTVFDAPAVMAASPTTAALAPADTCTAEQRRIEVEIPF